MIFLQELNNLWFIDFSGVNRPHKILSRYAFFVVMIFLTENVFRCELFKVRNLKSLVYMIVDGPRVKIKVLWRKLNRTLILIWRFHFENCQTKTNSRNWYSVQHVKNEITRPITDKKPMPIYLTVRSIVSSHNKSCTGILLKKRWMPIVTISKETLKKIATAIRIVTKRLDEKLSSLAVMPFK